MLPHRYRIREWIGKWTLSQKSLSLSVFYREILGKQVRSWNYMVIIVQSSHKKQYKEIHLYSEIKYLVLSVHAELRHCWTHLVRKDWDVSEDTIYSKHVFQTAIISSLGGPLLLLLSKFLWVCTAEPLPGLIRKHKCSVLLSNCFS